MKKIVLILVAMMVVHLSFSQTMARIVVSSCGTVANSGNSQINFTVGEAVVNYLTSSGNPTYKLFQGYQQIDTLPGSTGSIQKDHISKTTVHLYPNPAKNLITIFGVLESPTKLTYSLYNSFGKLFITETQSYLASGQYNKIIDLSTFSAGSYFLKVSSSDMENYFEQKLPLILVN